MPLIRVCLFKLFVLRPVESKKREGGREKGRKEKEENGRRGPGERFILFLNPREGEEEEKERKKGGKKGGKKGRKEV